MKEKVTVRLDVHEEGSPQMMNAVMSHPDVEDWSLAALDAGDLEIGFAGSDLKITFERKTPSDYAGTLTGKAGTRLDEQIQKLVDFDGPSYILIEGDLSDFRSLSNTRIKPQSLVGSVASSHVRYLDGVMFCSDSEGLVDMAIRLARKHKEEPSSTSIKRSIIEKDASYLKRALMQLDDVGEGMADALDSSYSSLKSILDASVEDLTSIEGIGEKRARSIYDQLHEENDESN